MLKAQGNQMPFESTEFGLDINLDTIFVLKISTMHTKHLYCMLFMLSLVLGFV